LDFIRLAGPVTLYQVTRWSLRLRTGLLNTKARVFLWG